MISYGAFITKEGFDVTQPQNPLNYILNTNFNTFKIYKTINGLLSVPLDGTGIKTFTHGLQYHPGFLAYYRLKKASTSWWLTETYLNNNIPDNDDYSCTTIVNPEVIQFRATDNASRGATDIEYKGVLLVDPIHLVGTNVTGIPLTPGIGFKASKPGIDVTTAKAHELLISSKYDSLKFHDEKQLKLSLSNVDTFKEMSFQHGLGYVPMFSGNIQDYNDSTKQRLIPYGTAPQGYAASVRADKSTITVSVIFSGGVAIDNVFKITVFKNKLSDA